jgi:hypothetical protein
MSRVGMSKGYTVVAVDFDDTLFERGARGYPEIGEPIWYVINHVKELMNNNFKLILWTCRDGEELDAAVKACEKVGLKFDAINDNIDPEDNKRLSRKIYASTYIDDKAVELDTIKRLQLL